MRSQMTPVTMTYATIAPIAADDVSVEEDLGALPVLLSDARPYDRSG
jgi:hypothetical protein